MNSSIDSEFNQSDLGDYRLNVRLNKVVSSAATQPGASFPKMFCSNKELEGAYRFFSNDRVKWTDIFRSHQKASFERISCYKTAVVSHDSTTFLFDNYVEREGLGRMVGLGSRHQGFFGHFSLAVSSDGHRIPLGIVGVKPYTRDRKEGKKTRRDRKKPLKEGDEAYRWVEQALQVQRNYGGSTKLIHAMDSEADSYESFYTLKKEGCSFVVRLCRDRNPSEGFYKLFETLRQLPDIYEKKLKLSTRRKSPLPKYNKKHPPRKARTATVSIAAKTITIERSRDLHHEVPKKLTLNFIHVRELSPPQGEEPIDWKLVTTEPIGTKKQLEEILEYYGCRWTIEEYFKALKTGCRFQQRRQESLRGLLNVLAVLVPVAWWLLAMKKQVEIEPNRSSVGYVSEFQKEVLAAYFPKLSEQLSSVKGVIYAIAKLGGHIKYDGPPGWQTLASGYMELLILERGYKLGAVRSAAISEEE